MRYLIFVSIAILLFNCKNEKSTQHKTEEIIDIKYEEPLWLEGSWARVGEKEGKKTYEHWNKKSVEEYIGMGCTLEGKDTVWREDIVLAKDAMGWKFEVKMPKEKSPTIFRITQMTKKGFVCENNQNEFPKKIEYAFDGTNINAVISGGGPTIPFNYVKMEN